MGRVKLITSFFGLLSQPASGPYSSGELYMKGLVHIASEVGTHSF